MAVNNVRMKQLATCPDLVDVYVKQWSRFDDLKQAIFSMEPTVYKFL